MLLVYRLLDFLQVLVIADNVSVSFPESLTDRFSQHSQVPKIIDYIN